MDQRLGHQHRDLHRSFRIIVRMGRNSPAQRSPGEFAHHSRQHASEHLGSNNGTAALTLIMSKAPELKLKPGDKAPQFSVRTQDGSQVSLADFSGKNVILYFYPRDDTPGCTKEACAFRDEFAAFRKRGAVVLVVIVDSVKSDGKFAEKFKLPFPLLADEDKSIVQAYGVWGQKSFMGRKYMGTHRVTFLIDPEGRIKQIWPEVKPQEHTKEVLAALT